jgi:hypothetical protein
MREAEKRFSRKSGETEVRWADCGGVELRDAAMDASVRIGTQLGG